MLINVDSRSGCGLNVMFGKVTYCLNRVVPNPGPHLPAHIFHLSLFHLHLIWPIRCRWNREIMVISYIHVLCFVVFLLMPQKKKKGIKIELNQHVSDGVKQKRSDLSEGCYIELTYLINWHLCVFASLC